MICFSDFLDSNFLFYTVYQNIGLGSESTSISALYHSVPSGSAFNDIITNWKTLAEQPATCNTT
jgi:hypothetical protein